MIVLGVVLLIIGFIAKIPYRLDDWHRGPGRRRQSWPSPAASDTKIGGRRHYY